MSNKENNKTMRILKEGSFTAQETSKDIYSVYAKYGVCIGWINLNNEIQFKHSRNSEAMNINAHFMVRREHNEAILSLMNQARNS
jgi:hypothetical protein